MPLGRRSGRSAVAAHHEERNGGSARAAAPASSEPGVSGGTGVTIPRHPTLPDLPPAQGELFFECTLFLYSVLALLLQFLNLYKTMWFMPQSYTHYAIKFYLMDPYLLSCLGLILGRRVTWCFIRKLTIVPAGEEGTVPDYIRVLEVVMKVPMVCAVICSFLYSFIRVLWHYPLISLLSFLYPCLLYVFLFYTELLSVFRARRMSRVLRNAWDYVCSPPYYVDVERVGHACTGSPSHIREEARLLVLDLSQRIKQSFFIAVTVAYYAVYLPAFFTPETLYVDQPWVWELCAVVFLTSFSLYLAYLLPLNYSDLLHRAASHLGHWGRLEASRAPLQTYPLWSDAHLWPEGSLVKYRGAVYQGEAGSIAAEPGNGEHNRFWQLSCDPLRILNSLCLLEFCLILMQFLMLVHSTDWQHIVILVLLMFANYLLLFKLFKDKVILGRIYHPSPEDETIVKRGN